MLFYWLKTTKLQKYSVRVRQKTKALPKTAELSLNLFAE